MLVCTSKSSNGTYGFMLSVARSKIPVDKDIQIQL